MSGLLGAVTTIFVGCALRPSTVQLTRLPASTPEDVVVSTPPITHTLIVQDLTLSTAKPTAQLGQYSIRLLSIADDGTTQIRVAQTDRVLGARPGECFVSYEFGQRGLQLLSASKSSGTATMTSRGCISQ